MSGILDDIYSDETKFPQLTILQYLPQPDDVSVSEESGDVLPQTDEFPYVEFRKINIHMQSLAVDADIDQYEGHMSFFRMLNRRNLGMSVWDK